jgi:hypothetical protein
MTRIDPATGQIIRDDDSPGFGKPRARCIFVHPDTGPCAAWPLKGEDYCLFHSTSAYAQELRAMGRSRGGRVTAVKSAPTPDDMKTFDAVIGGVEENIAALRVQDATPQVVNALTRCYELLEKLLADRLITRRLDELEGVRNADQD